MNCPYCGMEVQIGVKRDYTKPLLAISIFGIKELKSTFCSSQAFCKVMALPRGKGRD